MIEIKKVELPRPDIHCIRENTLQQFVKYCSKSTGNKVLTELEMESYLDFQSLRVFFDCLNIWDDTHILYDNTLIEKRIFTIKNGIVENLKNECTLNFILQEDLKEDVKLVYYSMGVKQVVTVRKDCIELFIHTLRLSKVECKIYIDKNSYVR